MKINKFLKILLVSMLFLLISNKSHAFFNLSNNGFQWGPHLIKSFAKHNPKFQKETQCAKGVTEVFSLKIAQHACKIMYRYYEPTKMTCSYELKNQVEEYCDKNPYSV